MRKFLALLRIQLLARFSGLKPANLKKVTDRKEKRKMLGPVMVYVMLLVVFAGAIIPLEYMMMQALAVIGQESLLIGMAVTLSMICTLIMSFFFIMTSLYFGKDAAYLAALPIKSSTILSAKLAQVWISETAISALFILPASILYGIQVGVDAMFYVRMVMVWLTVAILPICIVTLLSALLIRLTALWKHRESMLTVGGMVLMIAYFVFIFMINSNPTSEEETVANMTAMLSRHDGLLHTVTRLFPPAAWAADGLLGDWLQMALSLMVNIAAVVLTVWIMHKPYRRLSLMQTENPVSKKAAKGENSYCASTPFMACLKREWRQLIRVSTYALNTLPTALMPALFVGMIGYMIVSKGGSGEMQAALSGAGVPDGMVTAVLAAMMCFMAGLNPAVFTAVSREGRNGHNILVSLPVSPTVPVMAKMTVGMALAASGILIAGVIGCVLLPAFIAEVLAAVVLSLLYCYVVNAFGLSMDVKRPRLDWMTETEAIKQGVNTLKGMLIGFGFLMTLAVVTVGLFLLKANFYIYVSVMVVLMAVAAALAHKMLMRTAEKYYWVG